MTKKQPKLSYGPNMGLIAGEAQVAASETALSNVGGAFVQGASAVFAAIQKDQEEWDAKMDAYNEQFPSSAQVNFLEDETNKQMVRAFLNKQRDEYSRLAETWEKTKDRSVKDKMEAIIYSVANLDDQIKVFNEDKKEYRTAYEDNQLADGRTYKADFFTNAFTNNGTFSITPAGDISFNVGGKASLYKDHAGKWNNKNNISEAFQLDLFSQMLRDGEGNKAFYRNHIKSSINTNLKSTGVEGLQALVTTDLTGDNSTFSFEQQWANGTLDDKFYTNRKKGSGTEWMFDKKNEKELRELVSEYYTDVMKDGWDQGNENYVDPNATNDGKGKKYGGWGNYSWTTKGTETQEGVNITWIDAEKRRNDLDNFNPVGGTHGYYTWDKDNNVYVRDDGEKFSMFEVADMEGLVKVGENATNFNPATKTDQNRDQQRKNKGLATSSMMKAGDDAVATSLNSWFELADEKQKFFFVPWSRTLKGKKNQDGTYAPVRGYDQAWDDNIISKSISIIDPTTNPPRVYINPRTGLPYKIKTGDKFEQSGLDIINQIMEDANYVKKKNINTDFED